MAGVAALVLGRFPDISVKELQGRIIGTADPYPAPLDRLIGSGRVNAHLALTAERSPFVMPRRFEFSDDGDGDGAIEPGESGKLVVQLENLWADAGSVRVELSSASPFVEAIPVPAADLGRMAQGERRSNEANPFVFRIPAENPGYEKVVEFVLTVRADGRAWEFPLPPVSVGLKVHRLIPLPESARLLPVRPRISGGRVVWSMKTDETDWYEAVFLHDLRTNQQTRLSRGGVDQYLPDISGEKVLWFRGRDLSGETTRISLVLLDLSNDKRKTVSTFRSREPASLEFSNPYAVWDTSLWIDLDESRVTATPKAYLLNVQEGTPRRLIGPLDSEGCGGEWGPAISGGCVGFQSGPVQRFQTDVEGCDGFKARTGFLHHQPIGAAEQRKFLPDFESVTVAGPRVVAIRQTYPERGVAIPFLFGFFIPVLLPEASDIFLWNAADGSVRQLTEDGAIKGGVHISGHRIVWSQSDSKSWSGFKNWDIYLRNLLTDRTRRVSEHPSTDLSPRLAGGTVVWYRQDVSGEGGQSFVVAEINHPPVEAQLFPAETVVKRRETFGFNASYSDPDGGRDLRAVFLRIDGPNGDMVVRYSVERNRLYVLRGAGEKAIWVGGFEPGSKKRIAGKFGDLLCADTFVVTGTGNSVEVRWVIQLNGRLPPGTYPVILCARDYDVSSKPVQAGSLTVRRR